MDLDAGRLIGPTRGERRENAFYAVLPYALLGASTVVVLLQTTWGTPVNLPAVLALTLATTLWLTWASTMIATGTVRPVAAAVYYAGFVAASAGLMILAPWYGVFAFVGYVHAFLLLRGAWQYVGVVVTSMIMSVSYVGGWDRVTAGNAGLWAIISLVTTILATTSFYFADSTHRQRREQKLALEELAEANHRLEAALTENTALQARLLEQAREAGVLEERQRLARDIHDTLAQSLAGILTQLQAAEQITDDPAAHGRHLTAAMTLARESLVDARRTIHAVQPAVLDAAQLPEAIGDVARRWSDAHAIDAELVVAGDPRPLHADVEVTLLRAAQEALANVSKHAAATRVGLTLSYMGDLVTLDVRDDGVGFHPDAAPRKAPGGFGLAGMRQRVQGLAGRLVVESEPGAGTALSASLPAIPAGARS